MALPEFEIKHRIQASSPQKATACRDRCAAVLEDDGDVTVIASSQAQASRAYEVLGVDTAAKTPFKERTEAKDEKEAESNVVGSSKTRVVNEVRVAV
jgi:hypothetical protein